MREVSLGARTIGAGQPVFVVAEAGVAHFGDLDKARRLVNIAAEAGADAVKFQIYDTAALIVESETEWRERLGSKELRYEDFRVLKQHASPCENVITVFLPGQNRDPAWVVKNQ